MATQNFKIKNGLSLDGVEIIDSAGNLKLPAGATIDIGGSPLDVTEQIDAAIASLVDTAPESLNTLNELAAALGDDANFAATVTNTLTTVTNDLATKAPLTDPTFTGTVTATSFVGDGSSLTGIDVEPNIKAIASGNLSDGSTVVLNSDGTVSAVFEIPPIITANPESQYTSNTVYKPRAQFIPGDNTKFLLVYRNQFTLDTRAVIGTIENDVITFGIEYVTPSSGTDIQFAINPANPNQFVAAFKAATTEYGTAYVGTISGTTITFGSNVQFNAFWTYEISIQFDPSTTDQFIVAYQSYNASRRGFAKVGTVSGTSITFGTELQFETSYMYGAQLTPHENSNIMTLYWRGGTSSTDYINKVATITNNAGTLTLGTPSTFLSNVGTAIFAAAANPNQTGSSVVVYQDNTTGTLFYLLPVTKSGSSVTVGTPAVFGSTSITGVDIVFDGVEPGAGIVSYKDITTNRIVATQFTVSGNSITVGNTSDIYISSASHTDFVSSLNGKYLSVIDRTVSTVNVGWSSTTNLTKDNFIGFSKGAFTDGQEASIITLGGEITSLSGLTIGSNYFVQPNGTLSETAVAPVVYAGKAIGASTLLLNSPVFDNVLNKKTYIATAGQTTFNFTYAVGTADVYLNGIRLTETVDYTATNGTDITLIDPAADGDIVDLVGNSTLESYVNSNIYTKTETDSLLTNVTDGSITDYMQKFSRLYHNSGMVASEDSTWGHGFDTNGEYYIAGDYYGDDPTYDDGQAYLFDAKSDKYLRTFNNPDDDSGLFGYDVAMNSTHAFVVKIDGGGDPTKGILFVYQLSTGNLVHTVLGTDVGDNGYGGRSVVANNTYIVMWGQKSDNTSDRIYIFNASDFTLRHTYETSYGDGTGYNALDIYDSTIVAGGMWDDTAGSNAGKAELISADTGLQIVELHPPSHAANNYFGMGASINANYAVVSSRGSTSTTRYLDVFDLTGTHLRRITNVATNTSNYFADSSRVMSFDTADYTKNLLLVGNERETINGAANVGKVYLYDVSTGDLIKEFTGETDAAKNGLGGEYFGQGVKMYNGILYIASSDIEWNAGENGRLYKYQLTDNITEFNNIRAGEIEAKAFYGDGSGLRNVEASLNKWNDFHWQGKHYFHKNIDVDVASDRELVASFVSTSFADTTTTNTGCTRTNADADQTKLLTLTFDQATWDEIPDTIKTDYRLALKYGNKVGLALVNSSGNPLGLWIREFNEVTRTITFDAGYYSSNTMTNTILPNFPLNTGVAFKFRLFTTVLNSTLESGKEYLAYHSSVSTFYTAVVGDGTANVYTSIGFFAWYAVYNVSAPIIADGGIELNLVNKNIEKVTTSELTTKKTVGDIAFGSAAIHDIDRNDGGTSYFPYTFVGEQGNSRSVCFDSQAASSSVWWAGQGKAQFAIDSVSTGGAKIWTNDQTGWKHTATFDPNGGLYQITKPIMSGNMGSAMTSPDGPTTLKFNEIWTQHGITHNTSNGRFTVPIAGKYRITLNPFKRTGAPATRVYIGINTDTPGSSTQYGHCYTNTADYNTLCLDSVVNLQANDFIVFYLSQGGLYNQSNDKFNQFSIEFLG